MRATPGRNHQGVPPPTEPPSYADLTRAPEEVGARCGDQPPIPPVPGDVEPRPVRAPSAQALVPIAHRRIRTLSVYWHAGWRSARPACLAMPEAAARLYGVAEGLPDGFGLAVFDAFRPPALQAELFDVYYGPGATTPPGYISTPSADASLPAPHTTGGTVDLTLTYRGHPLALGTAFDAMVPDAHPLAFEDRPGPVRDLRRLLHHRMVEAGFVGDSLEWWHYEYGTCRWGRVLDEEPRFGPAAYPSGLPHSDGTMAKHSPRR